MRIQPQQATYASGCGCVSAGGCGRFNRRIYNYNYRYGGLLLFLCTLILVSALQSLLFQMVAAEEQGGNADTNTKNDRYKNAPENINMDLKKIVHWNNVDKPQSEMLYWNQTDVLGRQKQWQYSSLTR